MDGPLIRGVGGALGVRSSPRLGGHSAAEAEVPEATALAWGTGFNHNSGWVMAMLRRTSGSTGAAGSFCHRSRYFCSPKARPAKSKAGCRAGQPFQAWMSTGRSQVDLSARYG